VFSRCAAPRNFNIACCAVRECDEIDNAYLYNSSTTTYVIALTYITSKEHADESGLTFQAAITLNTLGDDQTVSATPRRVKRFSIRDIWTRHQTLLVRLAIVVFFILLITLLETLLPGKSGMVWYGYIESYHR
jgi:hypothetical protein